MSRLNLMDQMFYKVEQAGLSPVYMGGAMVVDPATSPYPLDSRMLADHIAARMERIPLMRKKFAQDPLKIGSLRLVDDADFDVRNHITHTRLPAPGGYRELTDCVGVFAAQRMDLSRPPWRYEVIDGLERGRVAVAFHMHHSILDGVGATRALGSMWSTEPVPAEKPSQEAWQVEATPTPFELLRDALRENAERLYVNTPTFLWKSATPLLKSLLKSLTARMKLKPAATGDDKVVVPKAIKTSLNVARLSAKRAVSYVEFPLDEIKALRRHYDCSINDLVLLLNSCAMEHYFRSIGETIDFDLVAGMPINMRKAGDESVGNVLAMGQISLHNQIADIEQRLAAIVSDTRAIKRTARPGDEEVSAIDGRELMGLFSPLLLDALLYGVVKLNLLEKSTTFNVVITNVPGSPVPMYLAGARQVGMVPTAPAGDTIGLTITASSSESLLAFGYNGCGEAIRDKELFVEGARNGFLALKKAAGMMPESTAKRATGKRKAVETVASKSKAAGGRRSGAAKSGSTARGSSRPKR